MEAVIRLIALAAMAVQLTGCGSGVRVVDANTAPGSTGGVSTAKTPAQPLVLAGAPPRSVTVGAEYSFQPTVLQGSGPITFTIAGKPAWATFNPATGALSGTPTANDVGSTPVVITITAGNGTSTASIGPFTIEVNPASGPPPSVGSATLNWSAPTEDTDGMPVTDLAGYRVHYGTSEYELTQIIQVSGAATTSYVVSGLSSGTYYFAVSAYNSLGYESAFSNLATKTL